MNVKETGFLRKSGIFKSKTKEVIKIKDDNSIPVSEITNLDKDAVQFLNRLIRRVISNAKDPFKSAEKFLVFETNDKKYRVENPLFGMNILFLEIDRIFGKKVSRTSSGNKYTVKKLYFTCKNRLIDPVFWVKYLEKEYFCKCKYVNIGMFLDNNSKEFFYEFLRKGRILKENSLFSQINVDNLLKKAI